jgi:hypothetical protein
MLKKLALLTWGAIGTMCLSGCTTVAIYQSPVAKFQTAVDSANSGIRTYMLDVNDVIAKGNIYDKLSMTNDVNWSTADLRGGIPMEQIQLRLQALSTISSYANALGAMANSKDVANLGQAAKTLGDSVNSLNATVTTLEAKGQPTIDLGGPVTSLVTLFGTMEIEHAQKAALETAIIDGATNVDAIIDKLKTDLPLFSVLLDTSDNAIWQGKVKIYNELRKKTDPKDMDNLINQFISDYNNTQSLRTLQVGSLLSDMENAHTALVSFAKSSKRPQDLSSLADQIDVFTAHVELFNNAIASIQSTAKPSP